MGYAALTMRCTKPGCDAILETPFAGDSGTAAALCYARKRGWRCEGFLGICPADHPAPKGRAEATSAMAAALELMRA